jgi:hypothetical protein
VGKSGALAWAVFIVGWLGFFFWCWTWGVGWLPEWLALILAVVTAGGLNLVSGALRRKSRKLRSEGEVQGRHSPGS